MGAIWHAKGIYLEIIKPRAKKYPHRKFLKAIPTALTQSLKDRDWRPLACKPNLSRNYKIAGKKIAPKNFESDSHGAHSEP